MWQMTVVSHQRNLQRVTCRLLTFQSELQKSLHMSWCKINMICCDKRHYKSDMICVQFLVCFLKETHLTSCIKILHLFITVWYTDQSRSQQSKRLNWKETCSVFIPPCISFSQLWIAGSSKNSNMSSVWNILSLQLIGQYILMSESHKYVKLHT